MEHMVATEAYEQSIKNRDYIIAEFLEREKNAALEAINKAVKQGVFDCSFSIAQPQPPYDRCIDEEEIAKTIARFLNTLGYETIVYKDGFGQWIRIKWWSKE